MTWAAKPAERLNLPSNKHELKGDVPKELELYNAGRLPRDFAGEIEMARSLRESDVRAWDYGLAFLIGNQDLVTNGMNLEPNRMREVRGKVTSVTNKILPAYRATVAAFAPQLPAITAQARVASYENQAEAVTANIAARALWMQAECDLLVRRAIEWASPAGNFGLHVWPNVEEEKIEIDLVSPYDLLHEPYAQQSDQARWKAVRKYVMREQAIELFPDAADLFRKVNQDSGDGESMEQHETQPDGRLMLWWVYFKDGRCGVWHKDQWVYEGTFPEWADPVILCRWTPFPNRLHGLSQILPAIIPQLRLNQLDELLFQIMRLTSSPQWLIPRQAMVDEREITNEPGQRIYYNDSARMPELRSTPAPPPSLWDALALQSAKIEDTMGMHSASTGKRVPNVSSGIGMETLIGQDEANLEITRFEFETAFATAMSTGLALWKEYLPGRSLVRVPGLSARSTVIKAVEMMNIGDGVKVKFGPGSMFADSAKQRDQQLITLVQYGLPLSEVLDKLSFQIDPHADFKRMQADYYSRSLLEAMLAGDTIEWVPDPDFMESIERVFGDFIRSPEYVDKRREIAQMAQDEQQAMMEQQVPGMEPDPEASVGNATDSLQALDNIYTLYSDVVMTRAQMMASGMGGAAAPMGSPPAAPRGANAPGQPAPKDDRKGQQSGPAQRNQSNGSKESADVVGFKSGGRRGAP